MPNFLPYIGEALNSHCELIQVMTRLVEDVEVSDELWEELIGSMQTRMDDKVPAVRVNAARTLARLVSGDENDSTVAVYRRVLETDRSAVTVSLLTHPALYLLVKAWSSEKRLSVFTLRALKPRDVCRMFAKW